MNLRDLCERIVSRFALRTSRKVMTMVFFCFVTSLYVMISLINNRYFAHLPWYRRPALCETPKLVLGEMIDLTFAVSSLLTELNISHALCYGTLWGALRYGKTLPWDNNVDFCVLKHEIQKVQWNTLFEKFKANHMHLVYDIRHGEYIINYRSSQAFITVFYKTNDQAAKDGFEHRFLWFLLGTVSFPIKLMEAPFKEITFHDRPMPVPHQDMEIQKFLYKNDWWLEVPPLGCLPVKT